jgi:hypothetical protein
LEKNSGLPENTSIVSQTPKALKPETPNRMLPPPNQFERGTHLVGVGAVVPDTKHLADGTQPLTPKPQLKPSSSKETIDPNGLEVGGNPPIELGVSGFKG